jgi:hypothetical protein
MGSSGLRSSPILGAVGIPSLPYHGIRISPDFSAQPDRIQEAGLGIGFPLDIPESPQKIAVFPIKSTWGGKIIHKCGQIRRFSTGLSTFSGFFLNNFQKFG